MPADFVDPTGLLRYVGPAYDWSDFLRFLFDSWEHRNPTGIGDPASGGGGGGGGGTHGHDPKRDGETTGLSECLKNLLKDYFPGLNLNNINIRLGLPGGATETTAGDSIGGVTIGNDIYTSSATEYDAFWGATWTAIDFAAHEITHSSPSSRLGGRGVFIGLYILSGVAEAMLVPAGDAYGATYTNNDFEILARRNAKRIVKDLKNKGKSPCAVNMGDIGTVTVH